MNNQNPLSITITSAIAILQEHTHSPIANKLVMPIQFLFLGNNNSNAKLEYRYFMDKV